MRWLKQGRARSSTSRYSILYSLPDTMWVFLALSGCNSRLRGHSACGGCEIFGAMRGRTKGPDGKK